MVRHKVAIERNDRRFDQKLRRRKLDKIIHLSIVEIKITLIISYQTQTPNRAVLREPPELHSRLPRLVLRLQSKEYKEKTQKAHILAQSI
jgi:hypothetical protein